MSFMPVGLDECDYECVNKLWTGAEDLKFHMRYSCGGNRSYMMYHAGCNAQGLNLDTKRDGACAWAWKTKDTISVQLLMRHPTPRPTPSPPTNEPTPGPTPHPTPAPTTA